ncbi:hypothetical protein CYMTET_46604 [Cymbomonas tetramitiformis]|uniref:Uncharacterized protein n=1 Tax=Cymbomonas tetramitiformis TaxID=36881 RepID=A0AAE0BXE5_9CHLO|nr:hypothetical protein CYMTET_46604 [Cymbomonas tetramitiformis]
MSRIKLSAAALLVCVISVTSTEGNAAAHEQQLLPDWAELFGEFTRSPDNDFDEEDIEIDLDEEDLEKLKNREENNKELPAQSDIEIDFDEEDIEIDLDEEDLEKLKNREENNKELPAQSDIEIDFDEEDIEIDFDEEDLEKLENREENIKSLLAQSDIDDDEENIGVPQDSPVEAGAPAVPLNDTTTTAAPASGIKTRSGATDTFSCVKYINSRYRAGVSNKVGASALYHKNWKNRGEPDTAICIACSKSQACKLSELNRAMMQQAITAQDTTRLKKIKQLRSGTTTLSCFGYVNSRYNAGVTRKVPGAKALYLKNWKSRGIPDTAICRACARGQGCNISDLNKKMMQRANTANDTTRFEKIVEIGGNYYDDPRGDRVVMKCAWIGKDDPYAKMPST